MTEARLDPRVRQARQHAMARWAGVVLFPAGLLLLGGSLVAVLVGARPWTDIMIAMASSGLGLATFGLHDDTARAMLRDLRWKAALPEGLSREMDEEFLFRRKDLAGLAGTPRMAWATTVLAPSVLLWGVLRLIL